MLERLENDKRKKHYKVNKIRQEFQRLQFIISSHKVVPDPASLRGHTGPCPRSGVWAMDKPTVQFMLFMGKHCLTWKCSRLLCFRDSPSSGVMPAFFPLQTLNSSCWSKVDTERKICHLEMGSQMHLLFPRPKTITFSPSTLFTLVPSALRKHSGLKVSGSFQSFLEGKTAEMLRWCLLATGVGATLEGGSHQ